MYIIYYTYYIKLKERKIKLLIKFSFIYFNQIIKLFSIHMCPTEYKFKNVSK